MPEGPEVRREADALARALRGRPLVRAEYRVSGLERRAKRKSRSRARARLPPSLSQAQ